VGSAGTSFGWLLGEAVGVAIGGSVVGAFTTVVGSFPLDVDFVEITDWRLWHE
jgi:hypothetical protein